jgi:uncharacterized membrane protein YtjA (UPF0391 family)
VCPSEQTSKSKAASISHLEKPKVVFRCGTSAVDAVSSEIGKSMLWTIFVVLCVLWLLGMVTTYTMGGLIHVLLVVALILFVFNLIQGRRRSA